MEFDISVIELCRLALLLRRKQNSLLIEGPQVDQTVEGETPGHSAQILQPLLIGCCKLSKVAEQDGEKLGDGSALLDKGHVLLISLAIHLKALE